MGRPVCRTHGCHRRTAGHGREYCTTCRPDNAEQTAPPSDLEVLVAAAAEAPVGAVTVLTRRDDDPSQLKAVGRCSTCRSNIDVDTFDVPDDPESWVQVYAAVLTALHGHAVTVTWALISPFAGKAPARPRLGYVPRLGALDG